MSSLRESMYDRVAERFYEAAVVPELWRSVLHEAAEAVGAAGGLIHCYPNAAAGMVYSEGLEEVLDRFVKADDSRYERVVRGVAMDPWAVQSESSLFHPDELKNLPLYNEVLLPSGLKWFAGTTVSHIEGNSVLLTFERSSRAEPYSRDEIASLNKLLPRLRSACQLAQRLGLARAEGALEAFDHMRSAALLLDVRGRVIQMNRSARPILGHELVVRNNVVEASDHATHIALAAHLQHCLRQTGAVPCGPPHPLVIRRTGKAPLLVSLTPIEGAARDVLQRAKVIMTIVDPDRTSAAPVDILCRAYGLTPTEARVAVEIGRGRTLHDIADYHSVSIETIRTQLKVVFAKTYTRRQSALAALVARICSASP